MAMKKVNMQETYVVHDSRVKDERVQAELGRLELRNKRPHGRKGRQVELHEGQLIVRSMVQGPWSMPARGANQTHQKGGGEDDVKQAFAKL